MLARGSGTIVNVASVAAIAPMPMQALYAGSKAGMSTWSEALRNELRGTGVNVLTVYPGPVATPMGDRGYAAVGGRKGLVGLMPEGTPDVLAVRIRRAIERRRARLVYPRFYFLSRHLVWLPRFLGWLVGPSFRRKLLAAPKS
jgi:short-subunit dehydrogenase